MTPGERMFDIDLVKSMRKEAKRIAARSKRTALVITQGADRLAALSAETVIEQPKTENFDTQGEAIRNQPASTPDHT